ncbi:pyridoxine 5'-phosphate synthase [Pseudomonadales bacterium]|jgi:pyridoxine 5-phosphate synthase|nr:pyridoxine 5'-phosphate synthase [Pseudomonadales bacterium]
MALLSVNLNKVALLRNSRDTVIPSVIDAAKTCIDCGARGITVHPRPDQRHIRVSDVYALKTFLADYPDVEFNIEGNPLEGPQANGYPGFMQLIEAIKPDQCTLVPDDPAQLTSDHGWNINQNHNILSPILEKLQVWRIRSSVFLDADPSQIPLAQKLGIQRVELYTGPYAEHFDPQQPHNGLTDYQETARAADQVGIGVNAGHDLNLVNLPSFVAGIPTLKEVSIGHALITDALWLGLPETVKRYLKAVNRADGL